MHYELVHHSVITSVLFITYKTKKAAFLQTLFLTMIWQHVDLSRTWQNISSVGDIWGLVSFPCQAFKITKENLGRSLRPPCEEAGGGGLQWNLDSRVFCFFIGWDNHLDNKVFCFFIGRDNHLDNKVFFSSIGRGV